MSCIPSWAHLLWHAGATLLLGVLPEQSLMQLKRRWLHHRQPTQPQLSEAHGLLKPQLQGQPCLKKLPADPPRLSVTAGRLKHPLRRSSLRQHPAILW